MGIVGSSFIFYCLFPTAQPDTFQGSGSVKILVMAHPFLCENYQIVKVLVNILDIWWPQCTPVWDNGGWLVPFTVGFPPLYSQENPREVWGPTSGSHAWESLPNVYLSEINLHRKMKTSNVFCFWLKLYRLTSWDIGHTEMRKRESYFQSCHCLAGDLVSTSHMLVEVNWEPRNGSDHIHGSDYIHSHSLNHQNPQLSPAWATVLNRPVPIHKEVNSHPHLLFWEAL